jgi:carotenoid cleavage dioxygenase-like enzyme
MASITPLADPYFAGNFAPVAEEISSDSLEVVGELPRDLAGVFVRNGSNARFAPRGRFHWFDGDGMVHALQVQDGKASYRNRWVRTAGFLAEEQAGEVLWSGLLEKPDFRKKGGPYKNTANTDLVFHAGQCLALWWMSGIPYVLKLPELETLGQQQYGGALPEGFTAHPKVDPRTGEMMFMHFTQTTPVLEYGVVDKHGAIAHKTQLTLAGPRLQHDIAITDKHTILLDMAMHADPKALAEGRVKVKFFRDEPTRFGILPRYGDGAQVRWFDAAPCYIYHLVNAWEEGDEVVVVGCRIGDPLTGDPGNADPAQRIAVIAAQQITAHLHHWRFNLKTGATHEEQLDDSFAEFPRMDNRQLGRASTISYHQRLARDEQVHFDGIIRYAHERGSKTEYSYPRGWFGGETVFAPRLGSTSEEDGYLLTFVAEEATGASEAYVFDAKNIDRGPLARVKLPQRVPAGFHAWWVPQSEVERQRAL